MITELKQKADVCYKEMNNKLGDRFIRENNSINHLCTFIKFCIENKQRIKREILIDQDEFLINEVVVLRFLLAYRCYLIDCNLKDVIVFKTPTPPPKPDLIEEVSVEYFSVESLNRMLQQVNLCRI